VAIGLALIAMAACSRGSSSDATSAATSGRRIRLWHTFNPAETEALNEVLSARGGTHQVESTLLPFQRGQTILREVVESGSDCPDLVRIDATWIPELARAGLLAQVPPEVAAERRWLAEAADLSTTPCPRASTAWRSSIETRRSARWNGRRRR
jgi:ABC-type glycerol-3-phosphate transport system substrate-binding protein